VTTLDPSDPQGLGNLVWNAAYEEMTTDGMNTLGDYGGRMYNRQNYSDYTQFFPLNPPIPFVMNDPDRWQPNIAEIFTNCSSPGNRFYPRIQTFITPQARNVLPGLIDPRWIDKNIIFMPPKDTYAKNRQAYILKTDQVIKVTASLNDTQKMIAEFFDHKLPSLGEIGGFAVNEYFPNDIIDYISKWNFYANNVIFTAMSTCWKAKSIFNAVRPFSSIRKINQKPGWITKYYNITSYAGPFAGTQNFPADQWESYLTSDAHPEYPSGTSCVCHAFSAAAKLFFGTDTVGFSTTFPKGSSIIEPNFTPHEDITVTFDTFTSVGDICGDSRFWSGVHFPSSVAESKRVCPGFAKPAFINYNKLLAGDISWKTWG